jgi:hypothetical protein
MEGVILWKSHFLGQLVQVKGLSAFEVNGLSEMWKPEKRRGLVC